MTASVGEIAARREIWVSFATLLRVYLAAASVGDEPPQAILIEVRPGVLHIEGLRRTVKLDMQVRTGEGYWAVYGAATESDPAGDTLLEEGAFRLKMDGSFTWSGKRGRVEMDAVAEALATLVLE